MNPRPLSRRGAMSHARPRLSSEKAARPRFGLLRRIGRIALYGGIGGQTMVAAPLPWDPNWWGPRPWKDIDDTRAML